LWSDTLGPTSGVGQGGRERRGREGKQKGIKGVWEGEEGEEEWESPICNFIAKKLQCSFISKLDGMNKGAVCQLSRGLKPASVSTAALTDFGFNMAYVND